MDLNEIMIKQKSTIMCFLTFPRDETLQQDSKQKNQIPI